MPKIPSEIPENSRFNEEFEVPVGLFYKTFVELCIEKRMGDMITVKNLNAPPSYDVLPSDQIAASGTAEKPKLWVELKDPNDGDSITQIRIRNWKVDERIVDVMERSCIYLEQLHTIRFWNAAVTPTILPCLSEFLQTVPNLSTIYFDNNPMREENWYILLKPTLRLKSLSLRFCNITNKGVEYISDMLGTYNETNMNLLTLNLDGNHITDKGANFLAKALRMNRTLLMLSLVGNKIGDIGAKAFANVLRPSYLTDEELTYRRYLICEQYDSQHTFNSEKTSELSVSKNGSSKNNSDTEKNKEKVILSVIVVTISTLDVPEAGIIQFFSNQWDVQESSLKDAESSETKPESETEEAAWPATLLLNNLLRDKLSQRMKLPANFTLLSLNLAGNNITSQGVRSFLTVLLYQEVTEMESRFKGNGLIRLELKGNKIPARDGNYLQIRQLLAKKNQEILHP